MSEQNAPPTAGGPGGGGAPPSLPDINAETYPFDFVYHLLNQAAYFNLYAEPIAPDPNVPPSDPFETQGGFVLQLKSALRRFKSITRAPADDFKVDQAVGERIGTFHARLLVTPSGFGWHLGKEPSPPIGVDPTRPQTFALLDTKFTFEGTDDSFDAHLMGQTKPQASAGSSRVLAGAAGALTEGRGQFEGLGASVVLNGELTPELGYRGFVSIRVLDPDAKLRSDSDVPGMSSIADPEPGITYVVMRGQKRDKYQLTQYSFPPGGGFPTGLIVNGGEIRAGDYRSDNAGTRGERKLRSELRIQQIVGKIDANILSNVAAPPGTVKRPNHFTTNNTYTFFDASGNSLGTIFGQGATPDSGVVFDLKFKAAPGQGAIRFGGFGFIGGGTGIFEGVQGGLCVNSAVGRSPHALSLLNVLRIIDPDHRFREALGG